VLVAGVGNIFLGDDAFGSEVARRLTDVDLPDGVRVVDYGIRAVHLAHDLLDGWDALVLVDAVPGRGSPGTVHVVEVEPGELRAGMLDAHGMDPGSVLGGLGALGGAVPRTLVVGCEVADVGEGIGLSEPVAAAVGPAVTTVLGLLATLAGPREQVS
jgi:hydrogenase maturation protease